MCAREKCVHIAFSWMCENLRIIKLPCIVLLARTTMLSNRMCVCVCVWWFVVVVVDVAFISKYISIAHLIWFPILVRIYYGSIVSSDSLYLYTIYIYSIWWSPDATVSPCMHIKKYEHKRMMCDTHADGKMLSGKILNINI